jgi:hypothetical protein
VLLLGSTPERAAALHFLAQTPATLQITQHVFGQQGDGTRLLRPYELLPAVLQLIENIFQPQQFAFTLAHTRPSFPGVARWDASSQSNRDANRGAGEPAAVGTDSGDGG